jgi:hypothetical protein
MRFKVIAIILTLCALVVSGQTDRGTLTGIVTDPAGAVVAGAPVEARNSNTGATYPTVTSGTGNYTLGQLPVGTYEISVSAPGFKKAVRAGIQVTTATTFRVDFGLEVGAATESVTITAEAPLLKTESGELAHNVSTDQLNTLPVLTVGTNGAGVRNPLASFQLLPGAQFASDSVLRINGMPSSSQTIRVEGQDATSGFWRQINSQNQTGVDAIQEVSIQTSNYAAEFGQAGGGYVNYTMRSGTNQFHGSAFDYIVNEFLNAGTPFTDAGLTNSQKAGQHVRNAVRRQDFGGTFGGPLVLPKIYDGHDKTFFFFSIEAYTDKRITLNGLGTVPTDAYRNGDFSAAVTPAIPLTMSPGACASTPGITCSGANAAQDALGSSLLANMIFDPLSQRVVNGLTVRNPFPGNKIPVSQFDPVAVKVQSLLPQATVAGALVSNYTIPSFTNYQHTQIPTLKIDHNLKPTIKISGFYSANHAFSPNNNGFTQPWTGATPQESLSQTTRINYDQSITPTLLMHVGAGLLQTTVTSVGASYDSSQLWGNNLFYVTNQFPNITPGFDTNKGGMSGTGLSSLGNSSFALWQKDTKPTFNNSFTWVKGNHTFKFGGEMIFEGLPAAVSWRSKGIFGFGQAETAQPYTSVYTFNNGQTGFAYASFLLGYYNNLQVQPLANMRLGNHSFGLYAQDSWKVNRRLTVDYGLRYDFATLLSEQYGRMQDAAFSLPNAAIGGRIGGVIYGGSCNCQLNNNYPWALGPRLGIAYQINDKTVLRIGGGISYGTSPNNAFLTYSVPDFYSYNNQPAAGVPAGLLRDGNPFAPGNRFGNPPLTYPDFSPHYPFQTAPGYAPPQSPFISIDRNAGRLPRIAQWSIGIQRQIGTGFVVDASYVGNRGVWWTAPLLATYNYNSITPAAMQAAGLNPNSPTDLSLLTQAIASADGTPNATIAARFPNLKVVKTPGGLPTVPSVYPGFPATQTLSQALRPYPQWNGIPPFLGPPLGDTWYDSLQLKVTKRLSHGLDFQYAFTWQKELVLGTSNDTSYLVSAYPRINDVFNYAQNKELNPFSRPLVSIIAFSYITPRMPGNGRALKTLSWVTRDWTWSGVLRYQSGALIPVPYSNNNYFAQTLRNQNPASWGGGATTQNYVAGQSFYASGIDPNCHCFDPTKQLVFNPGAWQDVGPGQFGATAPFLNDYRWQRQPQESMAFGRTFRFTERMTLNIRAEFQNIFNRVFYASPSTNGFPNAGVNPTAPVQSFNRFPNGQAGALSGGFGYVNTVNGSGTQPRSGQIVARFQF